MLVRGVTGLWTKARKRFGRLRSDRVAEPHYVKDYHRLVAALKRKHGDDMAMQIGVGGGYEVFGRRELALLRQLGLRHGNMIVDVGCGSGRLSTALTGSGLGVGYHGTDIVEDFLAYARARAHPSFRFTRVSGLSIPEASSCADFVVMFSVATHLMHHETYIYLEEAKRVAQPGGLLVVSYLEISGSRHWKTFLETVAAAKVDNLGHLNAFIENPVWRTWAAKLELELVEMRAGNQPWINVDGMKAPQAFGQSVVVLRKPVELTAA